MARCDALASTVHYRKGLPLGELFVQDVAASLELPGVGFEAVRYESRRADRVGNLLVDGKTYAAGSSFHGRLLTVGLGHETVQILDEHSALVRTFPRVFGKQTETIFEPASLVPLLVIQPGAWSHSPLRTMVTDPVRGWLDKATATDRRRLFNAVDAACGTTGFDAAIQAADSLIQRGDEPDMAMLGMLVRRLVDGTAPPATNVDSNVHDTFTTLNTTTGEIA